MKRQELQPVHTLEKELSGLPSGGPLPMWESVLASNKCLPFSSTTFFSGATFFKCIWTRTGERTHPCTLLRKTTRLICLRGIAHTRYTKEFLCWMQGISGGQRWEERRWTFTFLFPFLLICHRFIASQHRRP